MANQNIPAIQVKESNVGIGTVSPLNKLSVSQGSFDVNATQASILNTNYGQKAHVVYDTLLIQQDDAPTIRLYEYLENASTTLSSDGGVSRLATTGILAFNVNGSSNSPGWNGLGGPEAMRIITNGYVGIGTTNPGYRLDVNGDGRFIFRNSSNEIMDLLLSTETAASKSKLSLLWYGNETAALKFSRGGNSTGGSMEFWTQQEFGSTTQRMTITSSGNVGIGTTNPYSRLSISNGNNTRTGLTLSDGDTASLMLFAGANSPASISFDTFGLRFVGGSTVGTDNGSEAMRIATNGNVGIGTTIPSDTLTVNGTFRSTALWTLSSAITQWGASGTAYGTLTWDTGYARINATSGNRLDLGAGGGLHMTISTSGDVGIGTTNPLKKFHIYGSNPSSLIQDPSTGYPYLQLNNSSGNFYFSIDNTAGTGFGTANARFIYSDGNYPMIFVTNDTEKMRIAANGNVGIGTNSPGSKLTVNGTGRVFSALSTDDEVVASFLCSGSSISTIGFYGTGSANDYNVRIGANVDSFIAYTNNTERMRITNDGSVGIGTTTPGSGYLLNVNGKTIVNQFQYTKAINYSGADLDSLILAGFYDGSGMANAPNSGWFYVTVEKHSDGSTQWVHQTATSFGAGNTPNEVYTRVRVGSTWTAWKELSDNGDISGTTNYISKFTSANSIGNSLLYDNGTNVGIGTTSPSSPAGFSNMVELYSSTNASYVINANNTDKMDVGISSSGGYIGVYSNNALRFATNNTERMRIASGGNVGIGTTAPEVKLQVAGNIRLGVGGANDKLDILHGAGFGDYGAIRFYAALNEINTIHSFPSAWQGGTIYTTSANSLNFSANTTFGVWYSPDIVFPVGGSAYFKNSVGIGTTSPDSALEINGRVSIRNANELYFGQSTSSIGSWTTRMYANGSTHFFNAQTFIFNNEGYGSTEFMRITSTGNVGIGTTAPSLKLEVIGSSLITGSLYLSNTLARISSDSNGEVGINYNSGNTSAYSLSIYDATSRVAGITKTGGGYFASNVGIGTSSPAARLTVDAGSSDTAANFYNSSLSYTNVNIGDSGNSAFSQAIFTTNNGVGAIFRNGSSTLGGYGGALSLNIWNENGAIAFHPNNVSNAMFIATSGNVAIGSSSPSEKLQVDGTIWAKPTSNGTLGTALKLGVFVDSSTAAYELKTNDSTDDFLGLYSNRWGINYEIHRDSASGDKYVWSVYGDDAGHTMQLYNGNNNNTVRLSSFSNSWLNGGNVGIGTTSPSGKLSVVTSGTNDLLYLDSGVNTDFAFKIVSGSNDALVLRRQHSTQGDLSIASFTYNGNVGIGTTSPSAKLDVFGDAQFTSNTNTTLSVNSNGGVALINLTNSAGTQSIYGGVGGSNVMDFYTNSAFKMRLDASGNLGIGTTSPGAKLEIYGSGSTSSSVSLSVRNAVGTKLVSVFDDGLIQLNNLLNINQAIYINSGNSNRHYALESHIFNVVDSSFQRIDFVTIQGNLQSPAMGVGTMSPNTSAILDLTSRSKGFLPPRMTNSEMVAISSPAAGLVVYDVTNNKLTVYNGSGWVPLH